MEQRTHGICLVSCLEKMVNSTWLSASLFHEKIVNSSLLSTLLFYPLMQRKEIVLGFYIRRYIAVLFKYLHMVNNTVGTGISKCTLISQMHSHMYRHICDTLFDCWWSKKKKKQHSCNQQSWQKQYERIFVLSSIRNSEPSCHCFCDRGMVDKDNTKMYT